ncbi:molecular chaperone [Leclercia barmai]|uniref:fimbrial biogenesis chaperone n=1 Tax=Leclercia barmai TaxID=2785629 RepID=UPI003BB9A00C
MMKRSVLWLLCLLISSPLHAGIMAAGTRVIYPAGKREQSLMLVNTNKYPVVVQSWVDDGIGDPESAAAPFVALPAVFRLKPGERQGLRLIYNQDPLPQDRESVFWINLYEIPPLSAKKAEAARLTVAMNTQMKLFWRPKGLTMTLEEAVKKLAFRLVPDGKGWAVECNNPTPLNISFTSLALLKGTHEQKVTQQPDMMIRTFSTRRYPLDAVKGMPDGSRLRVRYLNDSGVSVEKMVSLQQ